MEVEYTEELFKLMTGITYKGIVITVNIGEYVALGKKCSSIKEAKKVVDDAFKGLEKSIKR